MVDGDIDIAGAAVTHAAALNETRSIAPLTSDDSVVKMTPSVLSSTVWPTSSVESTGAPAVSRSSWKLLSLLDGDPVCTVTPGGTVASKPTRSRDSK